MNQPKSPNSQLLQFMLRAQQLARQDVKTDKGYAMMMTSIITIMLFSLMGAFLTMTNLAKSSTDAYIDGNNTFYAAESGLNKRAQELRARFENYNSPSDGATTVAEKGQASRRPTAISSCYGSTTAPTPISDFECRNYTFTYNNNIARTAGTSANTTVLSEADGNSSKVEYKAFTFVADKTNYDLTSSVREPIPIVIAAGTYKDLNAQEYKYTVNATAAKPNENTGSQVGESGDNKTVLQMDFKSRTIPLFQFGAFYNGDLELNPSPVMTFNGRIHSNQKVYLTAGNGNTLTLNSIISAVDSINTGNPALSINYSARGTVQIQKNPADATSLANLPATTNPTTAVPVLATTFTSTYNDKLKIAPTALTPPPIGFLSKADTNRADGIGEYYAKADLRLEMFPDRSVPFKLQVIKSGGTTANTTCAAVPFSTTVSKERADYNKADCAELSEGQLRSLMQPVLVRPRSTEEYTRFCTNTGVGTPPQVLPITTEPPNITSTSTTLEVKERILDALTLTLAAESTAVNYSDLTKTLSDPKFATAQARFGKLLDKIFPTPSLTETDDMNTLKAASPVSIAALSSTKTNGNTIKRSCFRPAPIQALFDFASFGTNNKINFFDRREGRYIRMLQTNIESLTLWNRDGLFTQPTSATDKKGTFDGDLTSADAITDTDLASTFDINPTTKQWGNLGKSSADGVLFKRAAPVTTALVYNSTTRVYQDIPLPVASFRRMGLAAEDRTEGGLVFHATIDKTTYSYTARQSPYGFAFNDGANLPAPLTIATDQAVYAQGDWNLGRTAPDLLTTDPRYDIADKQPASFLADSIAILSNSCLNRTTTDAPATANLPAALVGQLNCGSIAGTIPATPTTVNAAFLSNTDTSTTAPLYFSGGLNNYMRILEDWTNQAMNYSGSFISLGAPLEVSGPYLACLRPGGIPTTATYACPPNRNWQYDTSFNSYSGLPPLPPKVIELQQDSFRRKYN